MSNTWNIHGVHSHLLQWILMSVSWTHDAVLLLWHRYPLIWHSPFAPCRNLLDGKHRAYPNDNYKSGDGKSHVWSGHGFYSPSSRRWLKIHEVKALPNDRIPDLKEFQSEDEWRKFQAARDKVDSVNCAGSGRKGGSFPAIIKLGHFLSSLI